jgi:hypothetical protein
MSEQKIGHCLPLYLNNRLLLSALENDEAVAADATEDSKVLNQFRERSSDQAVVLLEDLYGTLMGGTTSPVPYRSDRRSQRRTVRDYWYVEGRLYRPRERLARAYWNLFLGCLRDRGPAVTFIIGPQDAASPLAFDELAAGAASQLGLESANARNCFTHPAGYEAGAVVSYGELAPGSSHKDIADNLRNRLEAFFSKSRSQLDAALNA